MKITKKTFGTNGAMLYTIDNEEGLSMSVTNYGARIVDLILQKNGKKQNLILGYQSADEYATKDPYIGATIGRVAGRIAKGQFVINEKQYTVSKNEESNCLHGGPQSFEARLWETFISESEDYISVKFQLISYDGDNGFPGELEAAVTHTLTTAGEWRIDYEGTVDQPSVYNPTNHVYFNLNPKLTEEIGNHYLMVKADKFAVLNDQLLPTGELRSVKGTPFDFNQHEGRQLSQGFNSEYEQNKLVNGFDHPFLLKDEEGPKIKVTSADREITLEIDTTAPAVVIYTTNMLEKPVEMRDSFQVQHGGVTFETQLLPDAINHQGFGNIELEPNHPFTSTTVFKISSNQ